VGDLPAVAMVSVDALEGYGVATIAYTLIDITNAA
jgi:hypothetical protein